MNGLFFIFWYLNHACMCCLCVYLCARVRVCERVCAQPCVLNNIPFTGSFTTGVIGWAAKVALFLCVCVRTPVSRGPNSGCSTSARAQEIWKKRYILPYFLGCNISGAYVSALDIFLSPFTLFALYFSLFQPSENVLYKETTCVLFYWRLRGWLQDVGSHNQSASIMAETVYSS